MQPKGNLSGRICACSDFITALVGDERNGWGGRDRTCEWRHQKPLPYRLATPQQASKLAVAGGLYRGNYIAQPLNQCVAPSHGYLRQFHAEYPQVLRGFVVSFALRRPRRW
jgi:hypothetical protein